MAYGPELFSIKMLIYFSKCVGCLCFKLTVISFLPSVMFLGNECIDSVQSIYFSINPKYFEQDVLEDKITDYI